jgi:hypothetical protein
MKLQQAVRTAKEVQILCERATMLRHTYTACPVWLLLNTVVHIVTTRLQTVKQKRVISTEFLTCHNTQCCYGRRNYSNINFV